MRLVAYALMVSLGVGSAWAQSSASAPINPAFLQWQKERKQKAAQSNAQTNTVTKGRRLLSASGSDEELGLGLAPEIFDTSYLANLNTGIQQGIQDAMASSYDLRSKGVLTPVRNQNPYGTCWAYATCASLESGLLSEGKGSYDFSENNMANLHGFDWGFDEGGNANMSSAYLLRWGGPVLESQDPYPNPGGSIDRAPARHVQNVRWVPGRTSYLDNDAIKAAIIDNGALHVSYYHSSSYYRSSTASYYFNGNTSRRSNHAVAVVGWNDNYPKSNFSPTPPGNGAFIVRNSWGAYWGEGGYFYVSYYDESFAWKALYAFSNTEGSDNYDSVYQYDPLGQVASRGYSSTTAWGANIFTATAASQLAAVGFYALTPNTSYTISIYTGCSTNAPTSGTLALTQSGKTDSAGFFTIPLATKATLSARQRFSVVLKLTTPGYNYPLAFEYAYPGYSSEATASSGQSFLSANGSSWSDFTAVNGSANFCCKAYTKSATVVKPSLSSIAIAGVPSLTIGQSAQFTCEATYSDGSKKTVSPTWSIARAGQAYATVSASGLVTAKTVSAQQTVTVQASYTEDGVTKTATWGMYVTIAAPSAPTGVTATQGTEPSCVRVNWTAPNGATEYAVHRAPANNNKNAQYLEYVTVPRYNDTSAVPGIDYWYFIKAKNSSGVSGFSAGANGWRKLSPPESVEASDTLLDKVALEWSEVEGAKYYRVYRATSMDGAKTAIGNWQTARTFNDTTATAGVTYYYYVVAAIDASGSRPSDYSIVEDGRRAETVRVASLAINGAASIASGGNATYTATASYTDGTTRNVSPTWSLASGGTSYATLSGATVTAKTVAANQSVTLQAVYTEGGIAVTANKAIAITAVVPPVPTGLTLVSQTASGISLRWNATAGATSYKIYRASGGGTASSIGTAAAVSFADSTAVPGVTYAYSVSAVNGAGESARSATVSGTVPLAVPAGVTATGDRTDGVHVSWQAVNGASYYRVSRATSATGAKTDLGSWQTGTSYLDTSATAGTRYWYFVRAATSSGGANASGYSAGAQGVRKVPVTLSSISISGPDKVSASKTAMYTCTAAYSDGTSKSVSPTWSVSGAATIDANGKLTANAVSANSTATVTASFTDGTTKTANKAVTVIAPIRATAEVRNISVASRWPFSPLLDIDYELVTDPASAKAMVNVIGHDEDHGVDMAAKTLSGDGANGSYIAAGQHRLTWDIGTDYPGFHAKAFSVTMTAAPSIVGVPENVTVSASTSGVTLNWNAVEDATGYEVWRGTGTTTNGATRIATVTGATMYFDGTGTAGTTYRYWLRASGEDGMGEFAQPVTGTRVLSVMISFNGNGGTASVPSQSYAAYGTYGSLPTATRAGYSFAGWWTASSGGTQVTSASTVPTTATTLWAHWTASTYTVTLDMQSGNGGTSGVTATYGSAMPSITVPTRSGYTFGGYYTETNGNGTQYYTASGASARAWDIANATTLYAKWTANATGSTYIVIDLSGGVNATSYPVTGLSSAPSGGWTDEYKTTKLVLRKIPAGSYVMGRSQTDVSHRVTLTKPFYIGVFEVTQRQWELVMGTRPSYFSNALYYATRPVDKVSYDMIRGSSSGAGWPGSSAVDASSFIGKLRAKTDIDEFDLPTGAQWEYACRAGTTTDYNSGKNNTGTTCANMNEVGRYRNNCVQNYNTNSDLSTGTAKVGSYQPNAWGLYDMHGNVWEWCLDWSGTSYGTDPVGSSSGSARLLRSGSWIENAGDCTSSNWDHSSPSYGSSYGGFGFRLSRTLSNHEDDLHAKVQLWEGGPYWATTNIGAENPEDYGYYFWWGDTVGYKRENDAWVASDGSSSNFSFCETNTPTYGKDIDTLQSEGWTTAANVLAPEHDAAHVQWGGDWRMPTYQELNALSNNCDWTWTTKNGVNGYEVRGRGGYASNSIFLPAAGSGEWTSLVNAGSYGSYWSAVLYSDDSYSWFLYNYSRLLYFSSRFYEYGYNFRTTGQSVRPVQSYFAGSGQTYIITFDKQSGSGGTSSVTATYGSAMPSITVPTRSGYTFGGYYTETNGSGTQYYTASGASARNWDKTSATTLYARWTANGDGSTYLVIDLSGGTSASSYPVTTMSSAPSGGWTDEYKTTKLVLRKIPEGTYKMQNSTDVTLTKPFYIGVFEVTQRQYELVMGTKPSFFNNVSYYATRPVECVSYDMIRGSSNGAGWPGGAAVDVDSFIGKLRTMTQIGGFDLPTEAQWEYACRAGTTSAYNNGGDSANDLKLLGRYRDNGGLGASGSCTTENGTAAVGSYQPNAWGLYDMHGNVWEWCLDWHGSLSGPVTDPEGPVTGSSRVQRGGCWSSYTIGCVSTNRGSGDPSNVHYGTGFRLCCLAGGGADSVIISFDGNGGTPSEPSRSYPVNGTYGELPTATRAGYTFAGWWTAADGGTQVTTSSTVPVAAVTLYAHWTEGSDASRYLVIDLLAGANASSYSVSYLPDVPSGGWTDEYKTTKLVLRKIVPGSIPTHEATITKPYYIGVFEVTQRQYELIMGSNPSYYNGNARPVEKVSYDMIRGSSNGAGWPSSSAVDSTSFVGRLRAKTNVEAFDLPTEAQWEYACRAGTITDYNNGKNNTNPEQDPAMNEVGRYYYNQSDNKGGYSSGHTTVGSYQPNAWGLYDMHGNVSEWCLDWYGGSLSGSDPVGPSSGTEHVMRGGDWCHDYNGALSCTSSYRGGINSWFDDYWCGFRLAMTPSNSVETVTITFDANGGTVSPSSQSYTANGTYGSLPTPSYTGHTFLDWFTAPSDGTQVTESSIVPASAITLYAHWSANMYTVTLDQQNGNGGTASVTATYGIVMPSITVPTRSGYTFGGYWTGTNGSGTQYYTASGASARAWNIASATTLYAKWTANTTSGTSYLVIDLSGGASASSYPFTTMNAAPPDGWTDEYKTEKIVLRMVMPGSLPTNGVTLTRPYYIGVFEVTQRQYELVMGTKPSYFSDSSYYAKRPVERVLYDTIRGSSNGAKWPISTDVDASSFMGKLRAKTGIGGFDLPTEAQWEYACRAGTTTDYNSGKNRTGTSSDSNMNEVGRYYYNGGQNASSSSSSTGTALVGSYQPNAWGLYDMHGNVAELCLDWYGGSLSGYDPVGASSGSYRVVRGGCWGDYSLYCTSSYREGCTAPSSANNRYGFRLCCAVGGLSATTVFFDANGGTLGESSRNYAASGTYGELPTPMWDGYHFFDGWYTAAEGGERVTVYSVVPGTSTTLYAHWMTSPFMSLYDIGQ